MLLQLSLLAAVIGGGGQPAVNEADIANAAQHALNSLPASERVPVIQQLKLNTTCAALNPTETSACDAIVWFISTLRSSQDEQAVINGLVPGQGSSMDPVVETEASIQAAVYALPFSNQWRVVYFLTHLQMPCGEFPTELEGFVFHGGYDLLQLLTPSQRHAVLTELKPQSGDCGH